MTHSVLGELKYIFKCLLFKRECNLLEIVVDIATRER